MLGKLKKGLYLSVGLALLVKKESEKHLVNLVRSGHLKTAGAKKVLNKVVEEAKREGRRIEGFLVNEIKKEVVKARPMIKKAAKRAKPLARKAINKAKKIIRKKR